MCHDSIDNNHIERTKPIGFKNEKDKYCIDSTFDNKHSL